MQVAASITYLSPPLEIAFTGHSASHAPQLMQSDLITYAIGKTPPLIFVPALRHGQIEYAYRAYQRGNTQITQSKREVP